MSSTVRNLVQPTKFPSRVDPRPRLSCSGNQTITKGHIFCRIIRAKLARRVFTRTNSHSNYTEACPSLHRQPWSIPSFQLDSFFHPFWERHWRFTRDKLKNVIRAETPMPLIARDEGHSIFLWLAIFNLGTRIRSLLLDESLSKVDCIFAFGVSSYLHSIGKIYEIASGKLVDRFIFSLIGDWVQKLNRWTPEIGKYGKYCFLILDYC